MESASDAIFTVDLEGRFTSVNRGVLEESGRSREELIGAPYSLLLDPRDHALAADLLTRTMSGERQRQELRYIGAGGAPRVGLLTTDALYENDRIVGGLGIMRDTTDDAVIREADAQQARLAAVGALLGGVANEINNPLNALLAIAELEASSPTLGADDRQVLEQIRDEARRASRIVSQLLESTQQWPAERAVIDLDRVVRSSLELQGYGLRQRGVKLVSALSPDPLQVLADSSQLQQVLINLLSNAEESILANGLPGEIRLESMIVGNAVHVRVSDNGHGVAPEHVGMVFEPTFTTRTERKARGLGLTISRAIMHDHGGTLTLERPNANGRGATVVVSLPHAARRASGRSILLIEDEPSLRAAVSRFLRRQGYEVETVAGGVDPLAILRNQRFGLVLLDLRMQGMSGEATWREMLRLYPDQADHVLFITGDLHSLQASEFVRSTGRPVLPKPFTLAELEQRIASLLGVA